MLGAAWAAILAPSEAVGPATFCLREAAALAKEAEAQTDFLKREVALAALTEARHEASQGREAACFASVASARDHLRR